MIVRLNRIYIVTIVCLLFAVVQTEKSQRNVRKTKYNKVKAILSSTEDAVSNIRTEFLENDDVKLTWDPPKSSQDVDHYSISVVFGNSILFTVNTKNTNYTFTNLEACSVYSFVFKTVPKTKKASFRDVKHQVETRIRVPDKPVSLRVDLNANVVEWSPSNKNVFCATGFHLKFFHDNICLKDIVLPKDTTQYTLSDINACSKYIVTLVVTGKNNQTSPDLTVEAGETRNDSKNESYIKHVQYELQTSNKIYLQWQKSGQKDECIYDFAVSYFTKRGLEMQVTPENNFVMTDVNVCSEYRVSIAPRTQHREVLGKSTEILVSSKILVPGPVTNLNIASDSYGHAIIYWMPPAKNPDCVSQYAVIKMSDYMPDEALFPSEPYANVSVKMCKNYLMLVRGINGRGDYGPDVTMEFMYIPEDRAIENVCIKEEDDGLLVKWETSASEFDCLGLFKVVICALDYDIPCRTYKPYEMSADGKLYVLIPNIIPCVTYKISVSLSDYEKQHAFFSENYHSNTKAFEKPVFENMTSVSSHSAMIKWSMRDLQKNRCAMLHSQLECTTDDKSVVSTLINVTKSKEMLTSINDLKPFQNYSCRLLFFNLAGKSPKSDPVLFETLEDVPSSPASISAVSIDEDNAKVVWKPPTDVRGILREYRLEVTSSRLLYELPSWCHYKPDTIKMVIVPAKSIDAHIEKLSPYTEYFIAVSAASGVGFSVPAQMTIATAPAASKQVTRLQYTVTGLLSYTITWKQPCRTNGILRSFEILVSGTRKYYGNDKFNCSILANATIPDYVYTVKLPKLRPVYKYKVQIAATVYNVSTLGEPSFLEFITPASTPPPPEYHSLVSKVNPQTVDGNNGTKVKITLTEDMFDDVSGEIQYYALILGRDIQLNSKMENGVMASSQDWPEVINWSESSELNFVIPYQVTPSFWNPFKGKAKNENVTFVIGEDTDCEGPGLRFCNGALKPRTNYLLKIRAFTSVGYQDSPPLRFSTGSEVPSSARTNYLLVVCILFLFGFVVCGLYYVKSGQITWLVDVRDRMNNRKRLNVVPTRNINVRKFSEYYSKLQDSPHILKIEFNELNEISAKFSLSDNVAKRYDNYRKNRYMNVVPYDETRVKIQGEKGDYINASFIEGYKHARNAYIACQGPLVETFGDFWNMIVQYDVGVIIMLCQVVENKRVVCEKYFPDVNQTLKFDGISVECTMYTSTDLYEERKIIVTKGSKEVTVSHIKFSDWPDFSTPSDPQILVDFCHAVRKRFTDTPVVVHCSAGIGRTGTFIACDILLQQLPKNKTVNIFNTVLTLRKQRPNMVQSVAQYIYLYECVFYEIKKLTTRS